MWAVGADPVPILPCLAEAPQRGGARAARSAALAVLLGALGACASTAPLAERYVACSYDTVWSAAADTLKIYALNTEDKDEGVIETAWVETAVHGRPYGLFQREGLGDKERFRATLTLTRREDVTIVRLSERREHFGFRGGARLYQWYPIEPSQEAMQALMTQLTGRLEEQGCFVGT